MPVAPSVFDAIAFGPARTLDLHAASPAAAEAVRRAESWLRERQLACAGDVLVITGRGKGSVDGVAVVRPAVERLFTRLKRLGVVLAVRQHGAGAFVVTLAPVKALFEAPKRSRAAYPPPAVDASAFGGLSEETRDALRRLAVRSLEALGAPAAPHFVEDEMRRQLSLLVPGLPPDEDPDRALRRVAIEVAETLED
jgi:hypothetical protein